MPQVKAQALVTDQGVALVTDQGVPLFAVTR